MISASEFLSDPFLDLRHDLLGELDLPLRMLLHLFLHVLYLSMQPYLFALMIEGLLDKGPVILLDLLLQAINGTQQLAQIVPVWVRLHLLLIKYSDSTSIFREVINQSCVVSSMTVPMTGTNRFILRSLQ